jgi:hypothetical protein
MKVAVLLLPDAKQIMLTPENDHEKSALKMIAPTDTIEATSKWGTFDQEQNTYGYEPYECQGDYFRRRETNESLMLVIRPKKPESDLSPLSLESKEEGK